jgi:type I restriction enzyme S subunit
MSSEGASAMSEESSEKSALVPRRRFPEFREAGAWKQQTLADVCLQITNGKANAEDHEDGGIYPLYDRSEVVKQSSEFVFDDEAVIIPGEGMRFQPKYHKGKFNLHQRAYALMQHQGNAQFVYYTMDRFKDTLAKNAVKSTVLSLRLPIIERFGLAVPSKAEQQKIADCLSSLDELITAETQKLDALNTHKKGLMQQLFPREGEAVPRLRFPEFREAGEWDEKRLGEVGNVRMCKRILKEQTSPQGDIPFYKIGTFGSVPDAYISRELFENFRNNYPFPKDGAVLISAAGTIGRTVRYDGELAYFQDSNIVWLENDEVLIADCFLLYLYQLVNWAPSIGAIQRLYNENILGTQVKFPRSITEQQRIANCLSSLDDLITAQSQKIDALKTHKQGLMQQLFPVPDEVRE